jgi:putative copper export protein
VLDPSMQKTALQSSTGAAFGMCMVGLTMVVAGLRVGAGTAVADLTSQSGATVASLRFGAAAASTGLSAAPARSGTAAGPLQLGAASLLLIGAVLTVAAFALTGHTSVSPHRAAAATLLSLHLLIVAFWFGALWPLHIVSAREPQAVAAQAVAAFSTVAGWVVPLVLAAGIGLAIILVPDWSVFSQPYGRLLLAKLGLFSVLLGLASLNKWRFGVRMSQGDRQAGRQFRRTVMVEYFLICSVLAVTAVMTMFYSPEAA